MDLVQKEQTVLSQLKDFQQATVNRVHHLFTNGFSRVLVADEVGLGKTLVARGLIAKSARYHNEQTHDLFKVVYVCSNQNIVMQNLNKLKIDDNAVEVGNLSDTRLSMQHLKIFEDEYNPNVQDNFIQLIPLTPSTSFKMTLGCGSVRERALIFNMMKHINWLQPFLNAFEMMMIDSAYKSWDRWKREYDERVSACDYQSNGTYLQTMTEKINHYIAKHPDMKQQIKAVCAIYNEHGDRGQREEGQVSVIQRLRKMMAEASVDLINADLVVMDEFQRFPELIRSDSQSETALLAHKFFNSPKDDYSNVNILLLSATPYKPYSTLEEIAESGKDEHYKEFMQVTDFLFENHPEHRQDFKHVWNDYSNALSEATEQDFAILVAKKQTAETHLYKGIARTERFLEEAPDTTSIINDTSTLQVTQDDIRSYIEMTNLIEQIGLTNQVPVEYVKSAPFLMSFMDNYKLKENITRALSTQSMQNIRLKNPLLWLDKKVIANYGRLRDTNARLTKLKDVAMPSGAENLLWIPPSIPYYEFDGLYKGMETFSKVLVFSGWAMVPRSIATLISYEAERKTVGRLVHSIPKRQRSRGYNYFAQPRYPNPRLTFSLRDDKPANMNHLTLLYPSVTLAKLFDPIEALNQQLSLDDIKTQIKGKLTPLVDQLADRVIQTDDNRVDERWYYYAPLLLDMDDATIQNWFGHDKLLDAADDKQAKSDTDFSAIERHFEFLRDIYQADTPLKLGKKPDDLKDVLTAMVLGSPAICVMRMLENVSSDIIPEVIQLAKTIVDRFNSQEMTAVISMHYKKDVHWKSVLKYSIDGNIQAMLDEYAHMLLGEGGMEQEKPDVRNSHLLQVMTTALSPNSSSLNVDTYQSFKKRVTSTHVSNKNRAMKMRTNFAVGFYDKRNADANASRTDNVRLAFNSPFRPFVLATTSVGQEGLDFHYYCRKIMHWNLPSNPIDIEQRDGRINRYKSFSIRQKVAQRYNDISFQQHIWKELFAEAFRVEKDANTSELVPFWSLPGNDGKEIERIFPLYPLSKDGAKYNRLMKVLELYRLSLGQPRQGDLLDRLVSSGISEAQLHELFMNLSPFAKKELEAVYG